MLYLTQLTSLSGGQGWTSSPTVSPASPGTQHILYTTVDQLDDIPSLCFFWVKSVCFALQRCRVTFNVLNFCYRYSTVRPLSTLNYTTDMFNNSSIVSGIEFDKVSENRTVKIR